MQPLSNITDWIQIYQEPILFYVLSLMAIPLAYGVIFDPVIIRSGFLLIGVFSAISGIFFLLQADFLALAQIILYAVGITLVVVIALMLTNPKQEAEQIATMPAYKVIPGAVVSALIFLTIYLALRSEPWPVTNLPVNPLNLKLLGCYLTTLYSLPFELASILLLVALIGAILLAKGEPKENNLNSITLSTKGKNDVVKV